jgi:5,6-dimethylbenzimidazole synthase
MTIESSNRFEDPERMGVYRAITSRRDVRSQFSPAPVPDDVIARLLAAAHHAPSVGFMQPWEFIVVRDERIKREIHANFEQANRAAAETYDGDRRLLYDQLKLAAILDAPINLCVTCNKSAPRGHGLGRRSMPETPIYSTVCAIQNLWLAARAEGVGVGWVSILDVPVLRRTLAIPDNIDPVAYLCLGYVSAFGEQPELEARGWEQRAPLADLIHFDRYGEIDPDRAGRLLTSLTRDPFICISTSKE